MPAEEDRGDISLSLRFHRKAAFAALGIGLGIGLAVWQADRLALRYYLATDAARAETAMRLTINALEGDLARYEVVPQLLADLDAIRHLASEPDNAQRRGQIDALMLARNTMLQSSDIYIMRADGETVAASNQGQPGTFVGQNFRYRPYFHDALQGHPARFYGVGTTSGLRGYFFSAPVRDMQGRIAAVLAVKIGVDRIEAAWRGNEYRVLVTDPEGIVFMSSVPHWLYGATLPRTAERVARTEASRRYADVALHDLPFQRAQIDGVAQVHLPAIGRASGDGAAAGGQFLIAEQVMDEAGWTVHVLLDTAGARMQARVVTITVFLLLCAGLSAVAVLVQRRARIAERLAIEARARDELERRVEERTADLARVNSHLEQEIVERRATEVELRRAQANLVQVGKLAALGQMSAALSHEINQPLAAARNYADSADVLLERGDIGRARQNIGHILSLIDRMAAIGRHLRNAGRKPNEQLAAIQLPALLEETRIIVGGRLAAVGARLEIDLPPGLPPVRAGATRLQQVLVNLITNAADAVEGTEDRRITVSASQQGERVVIRVRDRGPGVPGAIAERIFDPFFTTKPAGNGLGLGLSISYNIIRDFGGQITLRDAHPGAEFNLTLAAARPHEVAA
ncbi:sensor histidine kinase [Gemmobacter serpentinus]|uniref:sensor histidine kinase n=1 Tax=Gemmobacter serpentinus TaxID=2652247 RepID=UPI00124E6CB1|nr:ATP-binding protein [Gemmobacter serpentinus]